MARQKLGQHFLSDAGWRERIARAIGISSHSLTPPASSEPYSWIEVGAGHGEMTQHLAATGVPVYAIELDGQLIPKLHQLARKFPNLSVIQSDILRTDLASIAAGRSLRVYGNLPYYITSPILQHFFSSTARIEEIHIVIQLEVAFRLVARPGTRDYAYLSVLTQYFSRPAIALKLPPSAFRPPPKVESALVSLKLPGLRKQLGGLANDQVFLDFVKICFAQKRKTLLNNLRAIASPGDIDGALSALNLKRSARAEELSIEQLARLYVQLSASSHAR
jgi:16S rRNA (adenine1518-N6/adenine1519-N6)-dimethyltransferase